MTHARKIYVQLDPDASGKEALIDVQSRLPIPPSGRMLPPDELHMTVIHFGKTDDVYAALIETVNLERATFDAALEKLIASFEKLAHDDAYEMTPRGFDGLGQNGHTLVIRYDAPPALYDLHARALEELRMFFEECGITDPDAYMAADQNFRYALALTPHVTLYKGYDGPLPSIPLEDISMSLMKIAY